jgi:hypothetical protein
MHHGDVSIFSQALRHDLSKIKEALQQGAVAPLQTEIEV